MEIYRAYDHKRDIIGVIRASSREAAAAFFMGADEYPVTIDLVSEPSDSAIQVLYMTEKMTVIDRERGTPIEIRVRKLR